MSACSCDDSCTCSNGGICPCDIGTCACEGCYNVVEDIPVSFGAGDVQDIPKRTLDERFSNEDREKFKDIFGKMDLESDEETPDNIADLTEDDIERLKKKFTD